MTEFEKYTNPPIKIEKGFIKFISVFLLIIVVMILHKYVAIPIWFTFYIYIPLAVLALIKFFIYLWSMIPSISKQWDLKMAPLTKEQEDIKEKNLKAASYKIILIGGILVLSGIYIFLNKILGSDQITLFSKQWYVLAASGLVFISIPFVLNLAVKKRKFWLYFLAAFLVSLAAGMIKTFR